jgi:hypothetical protein
MLQDLDRNSRFSCFVDFHQKFCPRNILICNRSSSEGRAGCHQLYEEKKTADQTFRTQFLPQDHRDQFGQIFASWKGLFFIT